MTYLDTHCMSIPEVEHVVILLYIEYLARWSLDTGVVCLEHTSTSSATSGSSSTRPKDATAVGVSAGPKAPEDRERTQGTFDCWPSPDILEEDRKRFERFAFMEDYDLEYMAE
eukprot:1173125-Prorocentrum_minimum.AAC.1